MEFSASVNLIYRTLSDIYKKPFDLTFELNPEVLYRMTDEARQSSGEYTWKFLVADTIRTKQAMFGGSKCLTLGMRSLSDILHVFFFYQILYLISCNGHNGSSSIIYVKIGTDGICRFLDKSTFNEDIFLYIGYVIEYMRLSCSLDIVFLLKLKFEQMAAADGSLDFC